MIPTINFHLIKACNFKCKFCYATFDDIKSKSISKHEQFELIKKLAESKLFRKINFAGGEPTLVPHLSELIKYAKDLGFETSLVTNASRIDELWISNIYKYLDILTLSVDSINDDSNIESGRNERGIIISKDKLKIIANNCQKYRINLKVNTVVSRFNINENLADFINEIYPFRWKLLQVTRVEGQNDLLFDKVKVSREEFQQFCSLNTKNILSKIKVIIESEEIIQGSYLMIDQLGRFYDSNSKIHNYSPSILSIGVENALKKVNLDFNKFLKREGNYSTLHKPLF